MTVPVPDEDLASTILWEMGTTGIEVRSAGGETVMSAYFPAGAVSLPALARAFADVPGAQVEPAELLVVDWTARFKESFRAFATGGFFIVPVWAPESPGEGHRILVDPGQAFGTGTHESTRLSLAALESVFAARPPRRVLDVGTGSGILSIAALALGAELAVGLEIDPDALVPAREHAAFNHAEVAFVRGDGARSIRAGAFDLVLANISAPLVIARAAELVAACRPGGNLVLAGLLRHDVAEVRAAYEPLADAIAVQLEGEWAALLVRTRA